MFSTLLSMLTAVPLLMFTTASSGSSWSASLNLLFFYITWSTLLLAHPPLKVELVGSLVVRALFFWLPALVSLLFDVALPSLARTVKLQGGSGSDRSGESAHRAKVVGWALVNTLLGVALQGAVEALFVHVLRRPTALRISGRLPLPGELLWDVFRGVVMREVLYYYIHRFILHADDSAPKRTAAAAAAGSWRTALSRGHRAWQHSITAPWAAVAHYDYPAAYLLARALPCYLPAVAMRFHLLTWFLFLAVVSVEEVTAFSGYSSIYNLLGGAARRVDAHFCSSGLGNYAAWGLLDWLHGTAIGAGHDDDPDRKDDVDDDELVKALQQLVDEKRRELRRARSKKRG